MKSAMTSAMTTETMLRETLERTPDVVVSVSPAVEQGIADSVRYLGSDAALASIAADTYWPKWNSPWWHMLVLFELGEARLIPVRVTTAMIAGLDALRIKIFPIDPEDTPAGCDPYRDSSCHCALGSMVQILAACGVDCDAALPWARRWFVRYQMADGGLSCDGDAYRQPGECPSSMVGTIAPFEAMLRGDPATWTAEHPEGVCSPCSSLAHRSFLERGAAFLIERALRLGSSSRFNAAERAAQDRWLLPCFPRLYFYDVVRGLAALVRWAEASGTTLPVEAVAPVVEHLATTFPDGVIRLQRRSFEGVPTMRPDATGTWVRGLPASTFPLLDATSTVGQACPYTTRQWTAARQGLVRLLDAGQLVSGR